MVVRFRRNSVDCATAATTTMTEPLPLDKDAYLVAASVGVNPATGAGPLFVVGFYEDLAAGYAVILPGISGWVRNDPNGMASDSLTWSGRLPLQDKTQRPTLILLCRNDTGGTVSALLTYGVDSP